MWPYGGQVRGHNIKHSLQSGHVTTPHSISNARPNPPWKYSFYFTVEKQIRNQLLRPTQPEKTARLMNQNFYQFPV